MLAKEVPATATAGQAMKVVLHRGKWKARWVIVASTHWLELFWEELPRAAFVHTLANSCSSDGFGN